jgi:hypothetical protein
MPSMTTYLTPTSMRAVADPFTGSPQSTTAPGSPRTQMGFSIVPCPAPCAPSTDVFEHV